MVHKNNGWEAGGAESVKPADRVPKYFTLVTGPRERTIPSSTTANSSLAC